MYDKQLTHGSNSSALKGTLTGARYLLLTRTPTQLKKLVGELTHPVEFYVSNLKKKKTWEDYKTQVQEHIHELENSTTLNEAKEALLRPLKAEQAIIEKIDLLIKNGTLQQEIAAKDELRIHYNEDLDATVKRPNKVYEKSSLDDSGFEIINNQQDLLHQVVGITSPSESVAEFSASATESIAKSLEYVHALHEMQNINRVGEATEAVTAVSPTLEFLQSIPVISNFIRGLNFLVEAYEAARNPSAPQRRTKIAAGLFGGLGSLSIGIVGALFLGKVGLLAAATSTPIGLAAAVVGVYLVAGYRDAYVLRQASKQVRNARATLEAVLQESHLEQEAVISDYVKNKPGLPKTIKQCQAKIEEQQIRIKKERSSSPINRAAIEVLQLELSQLCNNRDNFIRQNPEAHNQIINNLHKNPRLARLSVEATNLSESTDRLIEARSQARKKFGLSALSLVGVAVLLGAVCATGVGAVVVGAIGAAVLMGASVLRVNMYLKERSKHKAVQSESATSQAEETTHYVALKDTMGHPHRHLPVINATPPGASTVDKKIEKPEKSDEEGDNKGDSAGTQGPH